MIAQRDDLRQLAADAFALMRRGGHDMQELMHRDHVNVGFFFGALLDDPAHLLEGPARADVTSSFGPGSRSMRQRWRA